MTFAGLKSWFEGDYSSGSTWVVFSVMHVKNSEAGHETIPPKSIVRMVESNSDTESTCRSYLQLKTY